MIEKGQEPVPSAPIERSLALDLLRRYRAWKAGRRRERTLRDVRREVASQTTAQLVEKVERQHALLTPEHRALARLLIHSPQADFQAAGASDSEAAADGDVTER